MESDDSLPVLTDLEFDFPTLTPSTLRQPIEPVVTFPRLLQSQSRQTLLNPTHNRTPSQQRRGCLHFALLLLSPLTNYNLQPFLLLLETRLDPRWYFPEAHAPDLNKNYAICSDLRAKITIAEIDLQLPDNTKGNTSPDWRELSNALVSNPICIIGWDRKTLPGKNCSGLPIDRSLPIRIRSCPLSDLLFRCGV